MVKFSNETLTVLLDEFKQDVKEDLGEIKQEIKTVKDNVAILSKGQSLLGGTYHELQDVCQNRWERFERFEKELKGKIEMEEELKKNLLLYWIHKNKKLIITVIPWVLIIAIALFALITNNPDLLKMIADKIRV